MASSLGRYALREGDEVLLTGMEPTRHRALADGRRPDGAKVLAAPVTDRGELDMDGFAALLTDRTRIVSVVHVSNALGTVNPVDEIARLAKERGAYLVLDGAQAAPHLKLDMQELGCDFYCLSGHKMYGPSGIGVLWGKKSLLEAIPPYQGGGEMIRTVSFERTTYAEPPAKFEAGTPNIAGPAGLAAAADYLDDLGIPEVAGHEARVREYAESRLSEIPACGWWARRGRKPRWSPSWWTASTRTTSAPCSTRRASRCAPATTAPSRSWSVSGCRRRRGLPSASTTPKPRWTGWPPDSALARGLPPGNDAQRDLYREVILDHSRRPRNFGAMDAANRQSDGFQPALRRPAAAVLLVEDGAVRQASSSATAARSPRRRRRC